jgi:hypothetical protein
VVAVVASNQWSYARDSGGHGVNELALQPIVAFNFLSGWYIGTEPIVTANWNAAPGERWLVPLGGGIGYVFHVGHQHFSAAALAYDYVFHPRTEPHPEWSLVTQFSWVLPR